MYKGFGCSGFAHFKTFCPLLFLAFAVSRPAVVLADPPPIAPLPEISGVVAGTLPGEFGVNQMGAATYSIPLSVPPGTNGMAPKLTLMYGSGSGVSILGPRWNLSGLSAITRCAPSMAQDGYLAGVQLAATDRFCLDGQRLMVVQGSYGAASSQYRTESDVFAKVVASGQSGNGPQSFVVYLKNGLTYEYGTDESARHMSGAEPTVISWRLNKAKDRSGNEMRISYSRDLPNGEILPARIDYTYNVGAGLTSDKEVNFEYSDLSPPIDQYIGGAKISNRHKLTGISVEIAGAVVWRYNFAYAAETQSNQEHLVSVEECNANNVCLPATNITWGTEAADSHSFSLFATINDLSPAHGFTGQVITGDWNADGRIDISRSNSSGQRFYVTGTTGMTQYENNSEWVYTTGDWNGDGFTDYTRGRLDTFMDGPPYICWVYYRFITRTPAGFVLSQEILHQALGGVNPPTAACIGILNSPNYIGDFDGDGRIDFGKPSTTGIRYYLAGPNGFPTTPNFTVVDPVMNNYTTNPVVLGDWNGDGRADSARFGSSTTNPWVSTGSGMASLAPLSNLTPAQGFNAVDTHPAITGDWNGDSLGDVARVGPNGITLCDSLGNGFGNCRTIADFSPAQGFTNYDTYPIFTGDFNGDGYTDIGRVTPTGVKIYTIRGSVAYGPYDLADFSPAQGYSTHSNYPIFVADFNGDGISDIGRVGPSNVKVYLHNFTHTNSVTKITNGFGAETQIYYSYLTDPTVYTKGTGASFPIVNMQIPLEVVSEVRFSNGFGGTTSTTYKYYDLQVEQNGRGASGFQKVESTSHETGIVATTYYRQDYPFKGMAFKKEQRTAEGTLVSRVTDTWAVTSTPTGNYFPYISQSVEEFWELNGTFVKSATTTRTYDSFGNAVQTAVTRSDGSTEVANNTYDNDSSAWLLGQLRTVQVTKGAPGQPTVTRTSRFTYETGNGLLQSEELEPGNATLRLTRSYTHDVFGNVTATLVSGGDFTSRQSVTGYDTQGLFPIEIRNALNQIETRDYDPRHGVVTRVTGPNALSTYWSFDDFGRPAHEYHADGTEKRTVYFAADSNSPANAAYFSRTDVSGQPPEFTFFDCLNREIQKRVTGFDGRSVLVDKVYDDRGNVSHVSEPYFDGESPLWTSSEYDVFGRTTRIIAPGNRQVVTSFNGLTVTSTNPLQQTVTQTTDVQGQLRSVRDNLNNLLTYVYDAYGNPIQVIDSAGHTTAITYDLRGKKTRVVDPDAGTSNFTYNALGELLTQTNAKNETLRFTYDLLGRLVQRESPEGTERWIYDTAAHGVGQIAQIQGLQGYRETYTYDQLGRPSGTTQIIAEKSYTSSQSYDQYGRISSLTYPSGFSVTNVYNSFGFLASIRQGSSGPMIWRAEVRNARGQLERQTLGNGLVTQRTYAQQTGYLQTIQTGAVQNLSFQFDAIGNLLQRRDLRVQATEDFVYDGLNRLLSSQVTGLAPITMTYDSLGNILTKSDVGAYTYGANGAGPHAVTRITGPRPNSYSYDAAGNRISSSDGTIRYNSAGRPIATTKGTEELSFVLDPAGNRIQERTYSNGALIEDKVYIGSTYEQISNPDRSFKQVHYIKGADGLVAVYTREMPEVRRIPPTSAVSRLERFQYLLTDHLGSIQTITDKAGAIVEVSSYDSWGNRRNPTSWKPVKEAIKSVIDRGFTGHEHLTSVALIHMNGRLYDPIVGRFVSADPYVQLPENQQGLNRYSYVLNNPLSYSDPSGFFLRGLFRAIGRFFHQVVNNIVPIVATVVISYFVPPLIGPMIANTSWGAYLLCTTSLTASIQGAILSGMTAGISGMSISLIETGNPLTALRSGPMSFLRGFVTNGIGSAFRMDGTFENDAWRAVAHGVSGGTFSTLGGGSFLSGFASGVAGELGTRGDVLQSALLGGTASALTGGKFKDGALQGTFTYLYNCVPHGNCGFGIGIGGGTGPFGYMAFQSYTCDEAGCHLNLTQQNGNISREELEAAARWMSTVGDGLGIASRFIYLPQLRLGTFFVGEALSGASTVLQFGLQLFGSTDVNGAALTNIGKGTQHGMAEIFGERSKPYVGFAFGLIDHVRAHEKEKGE